MSVRKPLSAAGKRKTRPRSATQTREAILKAARQSFAANGFERTTLRGVATVAGCDPALIIRYFTNKQTLFIKAVDLPLETLPLPISVDGQRFETLVEAFLTRWAKDQTFTSLLRASATNREAAKAMRSFFRDRVSSLLSQWSGGSEDQATILGAMLIGLAWARMVIRLERLEELSVEEVAHLFAQMLEGRGSR